MSINQETARFYYRQLFTAEGKDALAYLKKRGLTKETIKHFGLGYASDDFRRLKNFLKQKGYTETEMVSAGLLCEKDGKTYDRFRNRVMFPIFSEGGEIVGFAGRALGDYKPKYLNTPETEMFHKRNILYALNFASKGKTLILCEGYMDVIAMHQAGFTNAVASCGTSFTSEHAHLIESVAKRLIIATDADTAGRNAVKRVLRVLRECNISIPVRILQIPLEKAKDPDEFILKYGAEEFKKYLKGISPFHFQMNEACGKEDIEDIKILLNEFISNRGS